MDGRLRTPLPVDADRALYESSAGAGRVDLALRWSHYIGYWDIGWKWSSADDVQDRRRAGLERARGASREK